MFNSAKKYMFEKTIKRVRAEIKEAWQDIKKADEYSLSYDKKAYSVFIRAASEGLFESFKRLHSATFYMPKDDFDTNMLLVQLIMERGDPMMYDYIYSGFRDVYEFQNKEIEKEWEEMVGLFFKNSKKLMAYEKILKEYPYSSLFKDYDKYKINMSKAN